MRRAKTTETPEPTEWHWKPHPRKRCPICGYPYSQRGEHQSVIVEGLRAWQRRDRSPEGWKYTRVTRKGSLEQQERIVARLAQAAALVARGVTFVEAARRIGVPDHMFLEYREIYPKLWREALKTVKEQIGKGESDGLWTAMVDRVRTMARSELIPEDIVAYLDTARMADGYAKAIGKELFPADGKTTLSRFFEEYYKPIRQPRPDWRKAIETQLRHWAFFTGDPPLQEITPKTLAKFRDCLAASLGADKVLPKKAITVNRSLKTIGALLNLAGPPCRGCRDGVGLIATVPWIRPPAEDLPQVKTVSSQHLNDAYLAAVAMEEPRGLKFKPPAWWRTLLVVAFNTGLRRRSLFGLRMEWIDWEKCLLVIPPKAIKSKRGLVIHLNPTAMEHLRKIRTDRELVFPWPYNLRTFDDHFHKLQSAAGIPRKHHFGLHRIRKTLATAIWGGESPQAAQLALGHAGVDVTQKYYVQATGIVAKALDALPQPAAFVQAGDGQRAG